MHLVVTNLEVELPETLRYLDTHAFHDCIEEVPGNKL